jgi:ribosomal-protein-alanine N-acetyltransferase
MDIETPRLLLRPVQETDADDIFEYACNPNVGPNAGWKPHENIEDTRQIMNEIFLQKEHIFGIVYKKTGKFIGTIGLDADNKRNNPKIMKLGYSMDERYWGKGLMTEAAKSIVAYGFNNLSLKMITCTCYTTNKRSRRVIQKCGFIYDDTMLLSEERYDGAVFDLECYCMTLNEWKQLPHIFHQIK